MAHTKSRRVAWRILINESNNLRRDYTSHEVFLSGQGLTASSSFICDLHSINLSRDGFEPHPAAWVSFAPTTCDTYEAFRKTSRLGLLRCSKNGTLDSIRTTPEDARFA